MSDTILVQGNTYPCRDQLKAMGARWDATAKGWRVPAERAAEAKEIVEAAEQAEERKPCWECGRLTTRRECRANGGDWWDDGGGEGTCYCGC
jgi:hypothetical protein